MPDPIESPLDRRRDQSLILGCRARSVVAKRMSTGTTARKVASDVASKIVVPVAAPTSVGKVSVTISRRTCSICLRNPAMLLRVPGKSANEFVAFATFSPSPSATSDGKVISDPPPATALSAPASAPATANSASPTGSCAPSTTKSLCQ